MTRFSLLNATALRSSVLILAAGLSAQAASAQQAAPAPAQPAPVCDPTDPTDPDCPTGTSEQEIESGTNASAEGASDTSIVVTGSRIRRPNLESNVPVTSIGGEEFFQQGQNNVGDTLNDLPQLRSTFAQQNPGAGVGIAGLNLLDLRGLGTVRTLVLVNGRRHVASDILNNASSPDVNTIPNDLIERVDVVTGGNSAVYGSDAIAGVVNFILRRDFDGLQVRGSAAVSEEGFGPNQYASVLAGKNFADGRGNITVHAEYANQERIYGRDIPNFRTANGFVTIDVDSAGLPSASDGFPDASYREDIRSSTINRFGLAVIPNSAANPLCGRGTLANNGPANNLGTPFSCNYVFTPEGRAVLQTGTRIGSGPAGTFLGGNGQTGREGTLLSILPSNERINTNLLARFEVAPALEVFAEAKYVNIKAVGNQLGPTFINNTTGSLGSDVRLNPRLDNPFLSAADRATLAAAILASGCGFTLGSGIAATSCVPLTAAQTAAVNAGTYRFQFGRSLIDSPDRDEFFTRDTYRVVGGIRGTFNTDWNYELSGNYGRMDEVTDMRGFVNRQRFYLSLDAGRNPATGQIQCRSQFDPASANGLPNNPTFAASLASDILACVPYNPFGSSDNTAAVNYFRADIINRSRLEQTNFLGFLNGDFSQLFELPGGPIRFAIGAEYRKEKAFNNSDEDADTGITNSVFLGDVNAKPFKVKEAFGELQIPLLKDIPLFQELTISGAGRVSDYNNAVGTAYAYNAGVEWAPFRDLRLRANYGRAVRAPNVSETSFPAVNNFANGFIDPCNANAIGNNPNRAPNCQSQLTAAQLANLPLAGYSLGVISGSNANLTEETSDSYTVGGVFTPRFLPGFSLSVDYYDIKVKDVIVTLAAQTIINSCYDSPGLSNSLCGLIQRNTTGSNGSFGELPGQVLFYTLVQGPNNFASRTRQGIDVEAAYRGRLYGKARFDTRLIYTHQINNSNFQDPARPNFENRLLSELGDPQDEFRWDLDVTLEPITIGYNMRYIGKQLTSTYENFFSLNDEAPLNADAFDVRNYPAVFYHNLRIDWRVAGDAAAGRRELNFYLGVDNLTDKQPPFGTTATGAGSAIYNIRGRNYYAGFRARF